MPPKFNSRKPSADDMTNNDAKRKPDIKSLIRVFGYIKKHGLLLALVIVAILISAVANVFGLSTLTSLIGTYIQNAFNEGLTSLPPEFFRQVVIVVCIYACGIAASYTYQRLMVSLTAKTMKDIRDDMFEHMQSLPIRFFDRDTHGNIMSRFTNDTDTLREFISQTIPMLITSSITVIGIFFIMIFRSWMLTLVVIAFLILMLVIAKKLGSNSAKYFVSQQRSLGAANGYIEEYIEGQKVVKVFCHEEKTKEGFDKVNTDLYENSSLANTYASMLMPIMGNMSHIMYVFLALAGAVLNITLGAGVVEIATIIYFLNSSRQLTNNISQMSQQFNVAFMAMAGAGRIFALLDTESEKDNGYVTLARGHFEKGAADEILKQFDGKFPTTDRVKFKNTDIVGGVTEDGDVFIEEKGGKGYAWKHPHETGTITYEKLLGDVRFVDVTFGYNPDKTVLYDISLFAEPGQKIAFVGSTGAGKTTITNLINRFYDVPDGKIRYDGININKIKKADLRRSQALVLQDTHLFDGTVWDNIRYGRLDATNDEIVAAAKLANAHNFIELLENGYDTYLTADGGNLSQGQRQLLAIARAAVANPPVLILDEATSSIDTRTERIIEEGMNKLMKGKTVFVIAHRLSTVRNSNAIMVLERGRIIERGDHASLIQQKGRYYQLYTGLFELS